MNITGSSLPEVMETFLAVERAMLAEQKVTEDIALNLLRAGRKDLAAHYLTSHVSTKALEGLKNGGDFRPGSGSQD